MMFDPSGGGRRFYRGEYGMPQMRIGGPVPPALKAVMFITVGGFLLQFLIRLFGGAAAEHSFILLFGLYMPYFYRGAVFQLFTFHFLHGGLLHLGFNLLMLWMFAGELELLWGRRKFIIYLAISGVGAGLCQVFVSLFSQMTLPVIGISGVVYGVLMAYGLLFPNRTVLLFFLIPMKIKHMVIGLVFFELYLGLDPAAASNIAHFAHLGGMLFGFLYLRGDKFFMRLRNIYYRRKLEATKRKHKNIYVVRGEDDEGQYRH